MPLNLQINSVYTFNTHAPGLLQAQYKNALLLMSCTFQAALRFENVEAKYRAIYPELPPGAPQNPNDVIFHQFQAENGEKFILADPWIDGLTLESVVNLSFPIQIVNVSLEDKNKIRSALAHLIPGHFTM